MSSLRELFQPVQNVSRDIAQCMYWFARATHFQKREVVVAAVREDFEAWEQLSDEALMNFEKRFD